MLDEAKLDQHKPLNLTDAETGTRDPSTMVSHQVLMIGELRTEEAKGDEAAPTDPAKTYQAKLLGPTEAKPLDANLQKDLVNKAEPMDSAKKNTPPVNAMKAVPEETDEAAMVGLQHTCPNKAAGCDWRSSKNK